MQTQKPSLVNFWKRVGAASLSWHLKEPGMFLGTFIGMAIYALPLFLISNSNGDPAIVNSMVVMSLIAAIAMGFLSYGREVFFADEARPSLRTKSIGESIWDGVISGILGMAYVIGIFLLMAALNNVIPLEGTFLGVIMWIVYATGPWVWPMILVGRKGEAKGYLPFYLRIYDSFRVTQKKTRHKMKKGSKNLQERMDDIANRPDGD